MQVKAIGEEKLVNKQQSVHMPHTFSVLSVNVGEENFGEWLTICQIRQFFPYQNFPVYATIYQIGIHVHHSIACLWKKFLKVIKTEVTLVIKHSLRVDWVPFQLYARNASVASKFVKFMFNLSTETYQYTTLFF